MNWVRTLFAALLFLAPASVSAQAFPALTGRVVDRANLLPPEAVASLSAKLARLEAQSQHQFVIVTLSSIGGRDIAAYSRDLGNFWHIGRVGHDDGALLVVAVNERKVRIAVANGLLKLLPDARSQRIIDQVILPEFRKGRMREGIENGSEAVIVALSKGSQ